MIPYTDYQLKLSDTERDRLGRRVEQDYVNAIGDHDRRIKKWREYIRRWRARVDPPEPGQEDTSNFPLPLIRWTVRAKWAKEMDSLFGEEAEIVAVPIGPSDYRRVKKIGRYMTWRVFSYMKLLNRFAQFVLYKILYGRAFAYSPWATRSFNVPTSAGDQEITSYDGPEFLPLEPDDFIVPAESAETLHDFSFVIRKFRATPNQLLKGEAKGRYQGIKANFERIVNLAKQRRERDFDGDEIKTEVDDAEGVYKTDSLSSGNRLTVLEWYGKWRMLKGKADADENDLKKRELYERELCVRYIRDLHLVISVQDLEQLYPTLEHRRPFVESSIAKDGSYWPAGLPEQLIDIEDEVRVNYNLTTDGQQFSITPVIFVRNSSSYDNTPVEYRPGMVIPVDDPNSIKEVRIACDVDGAIKKEQQLLSYTERLTGMSDLSLGRQSDRPNAPKTARGTVAILEEGNVTMSLDMKVLEEDMGCILSHFWDLEYAFSADKTFFRVTEEDADGLFPVREGGSELERADRDGRYDFTLKFATSRWSREAEKERVLARYQLDLQNPLVINNPAALWEATRAAHEALGDPNFADIVPRPAAPDIPVDPKEEWNRLLQGEDIHTNPMDNDELHMTRHIRDIEQAQGDPAMQDGYQKMRVHYIDHVHQIQQKKIAQALAEKAVQMAQTMMPGNPLNPGLPQMQQFNEQPGIQPGPGAAPAQEPVQ